VEMPLEARAEVITSRTGPTQIREMLEESDLNTNMADCAMSLLQSKDRPGTTEVPEQLT
jgi:hypothetical protein